MLLSLYFPVRCNPSKAFGLDSHDALPTTLFEMLHLHCTRYSSRARFPFAVDFIAQFFFIKSVCKSEFPRKSNSLFFTILIMKDKSTDLCRNGLVKNDLINTCCEIIPKELVF